MRHRRPQELYLVGHFYSPDGVAPADLVGPVEVVDEGDDEGRLDRGKPTRLPLSVPSAPVRVVGQPGRPLEFRLDLKDPLGLGEKLVPDILGIPELGTAPEPAMGKL